jgi:RimJ/RimL family protein N-acetyltransferase
MVWVTAAGTAAPPAAHAQIGVQNVHASAAPFNTVNRHALERIALLR